MHDLPDLKVSLRDVAIAGVFIVGVVIAAAFGYFKLYGMAQAGEQASKSVAVIECDIRQLKNYMIHGIRPLPHETCERKEQ